MEFLLRKSICVQGFHCEPNPVLTGPQAHRLHRLFHIPQFTFHVLPLRLSSEVPSEPLQRSGW
jgi:hypothetical protein